MALSALPKDVLHIILKKISLKDRLRLELLDQSHLETFRDPELWLDVNLGAMQALDLTEQELLCLLSRVEPKLKQAVSQIDSMAEILKDLSHDVMKQTPNPLRDRLEEEKLDPTHFFTMFLWLVVRSLAQLHQMFPETCGPFQYLWDHPSLKDFNPFGSRPDQGKQAPVDSMNSLLETMLEHSLFEFHKSKAAYLQFLDRVLMLIRRRGDVENLTDRRHMLSEGWTKAKIATPTVMFENLVIGDDQSQVYDELRGFLQESPSKLRIVFSNCLLPPSTVRCLCKLLGECGAGFVSFRQADSPFDRMSNPQSEDAVLECEALQKSKNLQALELDFPLMPMDVDSAARFLDVSGNSATLVLHLRTEFYRGEPELAQQVVLRLQALCASERGHRVTLVQHWRPSRLFWSDTQEREESGGGLSDAVFLSTVEQERETNLRCKRWTLRVMSVVRAWSLLDVALAPAAFFDVKLFGYRVQSSIGVVGFSVPTAVVLLWSPLQHAMVQGHDWDWTAISFGLCITGIVPFSFLVFAFKAFSSYMGACLLWSGGRQICRVAVSLFHTLKGKVSQVRAQ
ncbi:hypothetical protein KFL_002800090 [Klebsormidium nitens]|uniref:F-box domain-containing protein n=1 Tax=Klebsormidium nitens TaxID=105231 RepID=A0A1Y1IA22_KLENI|nr:hypothetical protein KFL_002800090 [Klebsormidium nitens]|eukprot:GAQ86279.1 hypothetical protein KFL_002800090 [Klebsormidium nitens]